MPAKKPANEVLDYVLKVRLNSNLKAVMLQCANEDGYPDISNWIRGMVQERCEKSLGAPEQFKLSF